MEVSRAADALLGGTEERMASMNFSLLARYASWLASPQRRRIARDLLGRADLARATRMYRDAGLLFEEVARLWPEPARFRVQAGHMFKEAGEFARAETHYRASAELLPEDADLALQLGHFYKVAGHPGSALAEYRRALALRPGWSEAVSEAAYMEAQGAALFVSDDTPVTEGDEEIIRELLPCASPDAGTTPREGVEFRRLGGRRESSRWGALPLLSGIEAIRGVCFSSADLRAIELLIDGEIVHAEPAPEPLHREATYAKYVFNIWFDLISVPLGPHRLEVRFRDLEGVVLSREAAILVATSPANNRTDSDGIILPDIADGRDVETRVRALPSVFHPARRNPLGAVENILVLRTDQLGDMVVSIPALRRLRALFPSARIVGLLTAANADLGRSIGLFDEVLQIDFPVDPIDQRRVLTRYEQVALRGRLAVYGFDLCVDLGVGRLSRPLMRLSGADTLVGVNDREWPWLTVGLDGEMHDPKNHSEAAPHSAKLLALVERLATLVDSGARIMTRSDLSDGRLEPFGVTRGDYIVLHSGAGQTFTRWPYFSALAVRLLQETDRRFVLMGGADLDRDPDFASLARNPRVTMISTALSFDDFDALLSYAALFVGNDSGPKHLAALRGVPVISLHNARTNWGEWGQEQTGTIISRRVPCAGCSVTGDGSECGKGFICLTDIRVDEVVEAAAQLLGVSSRENARASIPSAEMLNGTKP
jgi:ADP-heptose:LPS heptosyltransferase